MAACAGDLARKAQRWALGEQEPGGAVITGGPRAACSSLSSSLERYMGGRPYTWKQTHGPRPTSGIQETWADVEPRRGAETARQTRCLYKDACIQHRCSLPLVPTCQPSDPLHQPTGEAFTNIQIPRPHFMKSPTLELRHRTCASVF